MRLFSEKVLNSIKDEKITRLDIMGIEENKPKMDYINLTPDVRKALLILNELVQEQTPVL